MLEHVAILAQGCQTSVLFNCYRDFLARVGLRMSKSSSSSSGSSTSSDSDEWTDNLGESTDDEYETPASSKLRGKSALCVARCPRRYYRDAKARRRKGPRIPADMSKADFLKAFRKIVGSETNQTLIAATCHQEMHARTRRSTQEREKKFYLAVQLSNNISHKKLTEAFQKKHGIYLTFNFKLGGFGAVLAHLINTDRRAVAEIDAAPAKHPPTLDVSAKATPKPPEQPQAEEPDVAPMAEEAHAGQVEDEMTGNEGDSTDDEEVAPAHSSLRGCSALVTASCPRHYPRDPEVRKAKGFLIPEDMPKDLFLQNLRKTVAKYCTVRIEKATCHEEPHKRYRPSKDRRERHYHVALKMSGNFAHKKIADAFQKEHGLRISFSFKLNRFVANLAYLMEEGKKPSTDLDRNPAKYPASLDLGKEMKAAKHPGDAPPKESRKRKRMSFDEISNVIIEGIGSGPIRSVRALEAAANTLFEKGQVEVWNYMGTLKNPSDTVALLRKVWRLRGEATHPMWKKTAPRPLESFNLNSLSECQEWLQGKYKTHVLVMSGDGNLGKTSVAAAMLSKVCPGGYWFLDDPDDFREVEGLLEEGDGILVDEINLAHLSPDEIKKAFDLEHTRRVRCRNINATVPSGCPRIFCTNATKERFFPRSMSTFDTNGIGRRHLFQNVIADVRMLPPPAPDQNAAVGHPPQPHSEELASQSLSQVLGECWPQQLQQVCDDACLANRYGSLRAAAQQLGVAWWCELVEVADELMDLVKLTPLERRRFRSNL